MLVSSFFIAFLLASLANPCESLQCYDCSGSSEQQCTSTTNGCQSCMIYRSEFEPTKLDRRCCWWNCGPDDTVSEFNGRPTYFCNSTDQCNSPEKDALLGTVSIASTTPTTSTQRTSSQCYECSGDACGKENSPVTNNCPSCMVYRSPSDQTKFERRCCWWNCGPSDSLSEYNGIETYFCQGDKCNGAGESLLSPLTTTTRSTGSSTVSTTMVTEKRPVQCYECSGTECGKEGSTVSSNCPSCMAYRNPTDQTKIERRCCWWNCEPTNTVRIHEGIETYFCATDKCNAFGVESVLNPPVTTTTRATTARLSTSTATFSSTTVVSTSRPPTSSTCYECSGDQCGKEGSTVVSNCPSCMVYRNPQDQTKIERRCCWWNCGSSKTVGTHNGVETYFCAGDKCNGYGVESVLSPAITTTAISTTSVSSGSTNRMTTSTSSTCALSCQNGGIPETEDGCLCYCLENTYGRECEFIDCAKPDVDPDTCSAENQPLCQESETFAFECQHLCGKC